MPRGPLLDFDVSGPDGPAHLLPRPEIARRQARFLANLAESAGLEMHTELASLVELTLGFSPPTTLDMRNRRSIRQHLESGVEDRIPGFRLEHWMTIGRQCAEILGPRTDRPAPINATQQPLLVVPELIAAGTARDVHHAGALLRAYRDWLREVSIAAALPDATAADDLLESIADYGTSYDMLVATRVPLDKPFVLKYSERRTLQLRRLTNRGHQELVIADALTNHLAIRVVDPSVEIRDVQVLSTSGEGAFGLFTTRASKQVHASYAHGEDREFRINLNFRLSPLPRLRFVPYLVAGLLALLTAGIINEGVANLRDAALIVGPAALAASVLLVRDPSTLGSRLRVRSTALVLLAFIGLVGATAYQYVTGPQSSTPSEPTTRQDWPTGESVAKNTGKGSRAGAVKGRTQTKTSNGTWVKRDTTTGKFIAVKKGGGSFKGVRKESGK
jgi:hypothetical protein